MRPFRQALAGTLAATLLCGCTPTRVALPPAPAAPENWAQAPQTPVSAPAILKQWWRKFDDPVLDDLIDRALAANPDLRSAQARVREAAATVVVAESALYPSLDFFTSGGREKRIDRIIAVPGKQGYQLITPTADMVTGGLSARWELDIFGQRHLEAEAAAAQALGVEETLHAAQVGLLAQVATNYLELRGVQRQTALFEDNLEVQRERLKTLRAFYRAGLAEEAAVAGQEALLQSAEAALPALNETAIRLIQRLSVLTGQPPQTLQARLAEPRPLPASTPIIPKLLPSSLLAQRPDLRQAQAEVIAAAAGLGAARADLLPKLVLSASGGFGALAVGGFPSLAESVYALGAGLTAPIFNAGRIRAQIAAADARLDQVAANYEKTFLQALEDVENAFLAHRTANQRCLHLADAEAAAEHARHSTEALYRRGAANYLAVLDSKASKLSVLGEAVKARTTALVALVSLYRAFGGGWLEEPVAVETD
ncbi:MULTISPECIES: efflux transporter outer membrane subunit [Methylococcus]|jgi:NodT family efflux transporter outer membrane factor (OMF) lipoprotein|uniref:Outer membrane efflux family protein n=1 Tax=Methylococcus capsulatus TaxID=414 RepID=A0AA35XTN8_METCP|nr:efflux transporter outer membrane subunit [Methylococcus capsulatus]QXP91964.1 efflux transporter outer membrane subunit [Methylococcus capsulatus]CAI8809702.1 Outer membrane efflux family protein [Methylococcus capsulatus]